MYENVFHTNYNSFIFLSDVHVLVMIMEMIAKLGFFMFLVTVNETKYFWVFSTSIFLLFKIK